MEELNLNKLKEVDSIPSKERLSGVSPNFHAKWYKPTIDEFHYGFNYRVIKTDTEWRGKIDKRKFDGSNFEEIKTLLLEGRIEIKHISETDLQILGFQPDPKNGSWVQPELNEVMDWCYPKLRLWIDFETGSTQISTNSTTEILFKGILRNRSELKKLLSIIGY